MSTSLTKSHPLARAGLFGVVFGSATGCFRPEFGHIEVEQRSSSPVPVDVSNDQVTIPLGIALRLKVKPVSDSRQGYTSNDELAFKTDNASVMESFQIDETSQVVITGVRVGETCLRVIVNHDQVDCLAVNVVAQDATATGDR